MSRHRGWCFTINNFTPADKFAVNSLFKDVKYGICGEEYGEQCETPHLQGYVTMKNAVGLATMRKHLTRAHLTVANGTEDQNREYCKKQNNGVIEVGQISEQGKRNDIIKITKLIKNGEIDLITLMFDYPLEYVKYSRSFEKMFNAVATARSVPPEVHWRWGLAGTGKTRYCVEKHADHYIKDGTSWWDNYQTQEAIIIDDFENSIPFRILLRMLDRYSYQGQIKGGYVQINSPYIYITCEFPPEHYWSGNELAQIKRRLTSVIEIK